MIQIDDKRKCCGCSACAQACPKRCITMRSDEEGFVYPQVETEKCVGCGICEKVCPVLRAVPEPDGEPQAYAAYNKNETERLESSSGGIFTLLAKAVLKRGGVVFGAAMAEDCRTVYHLAVESENELYRLRGSKYLQSTIGTAYQEAERCLKAGRDVLFSGTPCEIEGLRSYLRREYENLLCVDVICHGVPSPKLWEKYVRYREDRAGSAARRTFFRHKKYGWKTYAVLFEFSNNTAYEQILSKDLFLQMFLQDLCLRPSCYACAFKKKNRLSDITLADFWGCGDVCPELDDDKGLSLVLVHSARGKRMMSALNGEMVCQSVEPNQALWGGNPSLIKSCPEPEKRSAFMRQLDELDIPELAGKYLTKPTVMQKIMRLVPAGVKKPLKILFRKLTQ